MRSDRRLPTGLLTQALRADVLAGLTAVPKWLPPKWFYDAHGSALFDKITELPEYYLARAERAILQEMAPTIAGLTGASELVELGPGSSGNIRLLLTALRAWGTLRSYVRVDVSESALSGAWPGLAREYPGLAVHTVVADFYEHLGLPAVTGVPDGDRRLVVLLGSTIGNMTSAQRAMFLARVRSHLRPGDAFLLGTDLVKSPSELVAAYDDSAGVTAAFNKNVLSVVNARLGADFDPSAFEHMAIWVPESERIEMRLRSSVLQLVQIPGTGRPIRLDMGEEIRTEICAKFRQDGVGRELAAAGLAMLAWWTDPAGQYALSLSIPAQPARKT